MSVQCCPSILTCQRQKALWPAHRTGNVSDAMCELQAVVKGTPGTVREYGNPVSLQAARHSCLNNIVEHTCTTADDNRRSARILDEPSTYEDGCKFLG